jgi:hypothetical protein
LVLLSQTLIARKSSIGLFCRETQRLLCHLLGKVPEKAAQTVGMRVWGNRYSRDLQRFSLAMRMIGH